MPSVELRPGDTLNIIWSSVQDTPLGVQEVESKFAYTYDDLLARLKEKGKVNKSKRSGTCGAKFSRVVALSTNALRKGKWSTGADIEREVVFSKLLERFAELDPREYANITENAKESLVQLSITTHLLTDVQQDELKEMLNSIGISGIAPESLATSSSGDLSYVSPEGSKPNRADQTTEA
jgi:hypothetical protein